MKKSFKILVSIFNIADTIFTSILYAMLILILTIFVWVGFTGLSEAYDAQFIWELAIFALTFFSVFYFFIKDKKYSFNEYVIAAVPLSALLMIISIGFIFAYSKNSDVLYEKIGVITMHSGMVLLSFALSHTSILIIRNQFKH